jgi:hypothetical protein
MTAVIAIGLSSVISACTGSRARQSDDGAITGTAPVCDGPGLNRHPNVTIRAVRTDGLTRVEHVRVATFYARYRMTLPWGTYTISADSGHVSAVVRPGVTVRGVDIPQPPCY